MSIEKSNRQQSDPPALHIKPILLRVAPSTTMAMSFVGHCHRTISRNRRGILLPAASQISSLGNRLERCQLPFQRMRMSSSSSSQEQPRYYDSHGDYQADDASGYFSTSTSLPLYQEQDSLPKFPVNSIETTIEKLKPSCLALVQNDQERKEFLKACREFPKEARDLQHLLEDRAKHQDNWLQSWWNKIGYLTFRDPSPINVNYIFNFPKTNKRCNAIDPVKRGAKLLHSVFEFSEMVLSGNLPQDKFGKQQTPLCSSMYKYMFYSCRIPKQGQDLYRIYNSENKSKHAIVSARGHYFSVDLVDPTNGRSYSVRELEVALEECRTQAVALDDNNTSNVWKDLGILTTSNRDEWTENRNFLMNNIRGMEEAMRQLESGLVLLCLESEDTNPKDSLSQNSKTYLMGTQGRWYDKCPSAVNGSNRHSGFVSRQPYTPTGTSNR